MEKKILIVEDNGLVFDMLKNELNDYDVERVRAVDEAVGALEENGPFDCYVVDLHILSRGLSLRQMAEYQTMEGYAFIKEYLFKDKNEEEIAKLKSKIIICSAYVNDFKKKYPREEYKDYKLVDKTKGFEKKVVTLIKKICK